ncbi:MAG TPA: MaoC family dehydratase [Tianweitania sediminis]|nr:MaoC family dehydratase [Tianweitania sediminis]
MTLDEYFALGQTQDLGSHIFTAEEIITFARKFDPQPFHLSEEAAKNSVFGALCASGWHTASMWMRHNLLHAAPREWAGEGPKPEFGPSPGFQNLRWLKPAYAGDTIRFARTSTAHRALTSRPGWRILNAHGEAFNSANEKIMGIDTAVLMKVA